jgi:hypothetical protein
LSLALWLSAGKTLFKGPFRVPVTYCDLKVFMAVPNFEQIVTSSAKIERFRAKIERLIAQAKILKK